jgi:hypothetical protein
VDSEEPPEVPAPTPDPLPGESGIVESGGDPFGAEVDGLSASGELDPLDGIAPVDVDPGIGSVGGVTGGPVGGLVPLGLPFGDFGLGDFGPFGLCPAWPPELLGGSGEDEEPPPAPVPNPLPAESGESSPPPFLGKLGCG